MAEGQPVENAVLIALKSEQTKSGKTEGKVLPVTAGTLSAGIGRISSSSHFPVKAGGRARSSKARQARHPESAVEP